VNFFVVITCPRTGYEVPTGIVTDITSLNTLPKGKTELRCPACGEIHEWTANDAVLAHSLSGLDHSWPRREDCE
jgi:hypothetical protein